MVTKKIFLRNADEAVQILGRQDENIRRLERALGVQIFVKQSSHAGDFSLVVRGASSKVDTALAEIESLRRDDADARHAPSPAMASPEQAAHYQHDILYVTHQGRQVAPRTEHQRAYAAALLSYDLVFGIGPAGTGKTFMAVAGALRALQAGSVSRIVITRPVVEAGEKLGFLPGDLYEKINPYLKPLYDAFYVMIGPERFRFLREEETIEIVPLAYMRGRTIDSAYLILDEAQNTTPEQMKMFLTRIGAESRVVVTGDVTQIDLDARKQSGLVAAERILSGVDGIKFVHFTADDVVRHGLVKKIIRAYEEDKKTR